MAEPWRLAGALEVLRAEVNARWPNRDKRSDGSIGDAAHAARKSDHDPWIRLNGVGVVRAIDVDKDLTGPATDPQTITDSDLIVALAERLRTLGRAGDPRLAGGGYVILRGRIASEVAGWAWRPYTGANAHAHHLHVSVSRNSAGFESRAPWGVAGAPAVLQSTHAPTTPQEDDLTPEQAQQLAAVHHEVTSRLANRTRDPKATGSDTMLGYAANGDGYGYRIEAYLRSDAFLDAVAARVAAKVSPR